MDLPGCVRQKSGSCCSLPSFSFPAIDEEREKMLSLGWLGLIRKGVQVGMKVAKAVKDSKR